MMILFRNVALEDVHASVQLNLLQKHEQVLDGGVPVAQVVEEGLGSAVSLHHVVPPHLINLPDLELKMLASQGLPGFVHVEHVLNVFELSVGKVVNELLGTSWSLVPANSPHHPPVHSDFFRSQSSSFQYMFYV